MTRRSGAPAGGRMVAVALVAWAAGSAAILAPSTATVCAIVTAAGTAGSIGMLARRRRRIWATLAVALVAASAVCTHVAIAQPARSSLVELAGGGGRALEAEIVATGRVAAGASGEVWFDATVLTARVGDRGGGAGQPITVGVGAEYVPSLAGADLGARLAVRGSVLPADAGERAVIVVRVHAPVEVRAGPTGLLGGLADMRAALVASAATLPAPGGALVPGLAVGDTSAVDPALDEAMKASSLAHLTAVSGANCAIVVALAFGLAAWCGARRGVRVAAGAVALTGFVLLVTPEPSVVRAAVMAAVAMIAVLVGRPGVGLAGLGLAVTVLLILDPWLAASLGFALSAVATGALLVLARPLSDTLARAMPRPLALGIAVPLAAQLACAPLLVLVDPRVPLLGVVANMLAAPAAPIATICGFLGALAAPLPWVQDGLLGIAWLPASWIAGVARTFGGAGAAQVPWMEGIPGALALALVCGLVIAALWAPRGRARGVRAIRAIAVAAVAVIVGLAGGRTALETVSGPWAAPPEWRLALCDVGQGDALLVRSGGAVALVDTGPDPTVLDRCLGRFGVSRIDLLVLTHFDLDHVGGAATLTGRVGTVLHGPPEPGDPALEVLADAGATLVEVSTGRTGMLGDARWRVLWPSTSVRDPGNDASVVLEISGDDLPRTVLLGDLSAEPQARLRAIVSDADVVKVAHHGSADQDAALYEALDAELALVPVGSENDYGHPRATLLDMLRAQGTTIARSDTDGAIAVWRDDGELRLWREHGGGGAG